MPKSAAGVNCDKTEEQPVQISTPYERTFSLSEKKRLVERPVLLEDWGQLAPVEAPQP